MIGAPQQCRGRRCIGASVIALRRPASLTLAAIGTAVRESERQAKKVKVEVAQPRGCRHAGGPTVWPGKSAVIYNAITLVFTAVSNQGDNLVTN